MALSSLQVIDLEDLVATILEDTVGWCMLSVVDCLASTPAPVLLGLVAGVISSNAAVCLNRSTTASLRCGNL